MRHGVCQICALVKNTFGGEPLEFGKFRGGGQRTLWLSKNVYLWGGLALLPLHRIPRYSHQYQQTHRIDKSCITFCFYLVRQYALVYIFISPRFRFILVTPDGESQSEKIRLKCFGFFQLLFGVFSPSQKKKKMLYVF